MLMINAEPSKALGEKPDEIDQPLAAKSAAQRCARLAGPYVGHQHPAISYHSAAELTRYTKSTLHGRIFVQRSAFGVCTSVSLVNALQRSKYVMRLETRKGGKAERLLVGYP
ncbi:hypothetical protein N7539_006381 [Penicillium diatomitis]|uniref:Uncharacterized protein n=1 Tax=Penicillium diatomitis TaxID=2819901 RepID=A0A9X0BT74_9EURO|nr:uncharacterized protein N7539_006381 [Penicillium diatomitis]KAJ5482935.1 hypothetical protein N7539_006381 [Penicillium diatomitis]